MCLIDVNMIFFFVRYVIFIYLFEREVDFNEKRHWRVSCKAEVRGRWRENAEEGGGHWWVLGWGGGGEMWEGESDELAAQWKMKKRESRAMVRCSLGGL